MAAKWLNNSFLSLTIRYSDFIVHELAKDGAMVKLSSYSLPVETAEVSMFYVVT